MIGHTRHMELYEMVSIVLTLKSSHMYHIKTLHHHHHCGLNQDVVLLCPSGHLLGCFLSSILDMIFSSNHNIHKSSCGLFFRLQTLYLKEITKIYRLKGLKPKSKGHTNFYQCCDLTKKVYLTFSDLRRRR